MASIRMVKVSEDDLDGLDKQVKILAEAKEAIAANEKVKDDVQPALVAEFKRLGVKSRKVSDGDTVIQAALVEQERTTIDEDGLKKAVGAALWEKITTRTLDTEKVEAALSLGLLDPTVLAQYSSLRPTSYIRTPRKPREAK